MLATAVSWIAASVALVAVVAVASPLWSEGQALWLTVAIGLIAGLLMAFVIAAITGYALMRLIGPVERR